MKHIILEKIYSDEEMKLKKGHWFDESHIKKIINSDSKIFVKKNEKLKLIAIFKKKFIPENINKLGFESFFKVPVPNRGRGAAAGLINPKSIYWSKRKPVKTNKWSTYYMKNGKISKMRVNNQVSSNIIGFYEGTIFLNLPPRITSFTKKNIEKISKGLPYIYKLNDFYKKYVRKIYENQLKFCRNELTIPNTAFSTITVNRNFRTGLHKDAGNFEDGFAVMSVLERGKYKGGYTLFPQYGVAFDLRQGDCIVFDNTKEWHCNTPFYETIEDKKYNKSLKNIYNDKLSTGTIGNENKFTRLSFVAYLRDKIAKLDNFDFKNDDFNWNNYVNIVNV